MNSLKKNRLIICLFIMGVMLITNGSYIKFKAILADYLIANTWKERQLDGVPKKPWPWADTWVAAKISIPRLRIHQFIMQDASGESLAFGPGAVLPIKQSSYKMIAGHRDTHFSFLDDLKQGDIIEIESHTGIKESYQITTLQVIDIRDGPLIVDKDSYGLSLITCWPMDSIIPGGPLRYVVSGEVYQG